MLPPLPRRSVWAYCFAHSPSRISLPRKGCRVGLRIVLFEACSAFTRVTACTLALSPYFVTRFTRRLQPLRRLHDCSGCFRLERLPGGTCTHWKAPPCHGAHPTRTSAEVTESFQSRHRRCRSSDIAAVSGSPSPLWQAESAADRPRSGEAGGIRHRGHWRIVLTSRKAGRSTWNRF